jgi:alcohol dehydrogenase class IV
MRVTAEALGVQNAAQGLFDLAVRVGARVALKDIGMPADGLERAAELATQNPYANPRPVEYAGVLQLLRNAYSGNRPGSAVDLVTG